MRVALTIAGSDSSGGAGLQADLKTFASLGVYGLSVATAITAQSTVGVVQAQALSADLVTAQIEAVAGYIEAHAAKTGMLGNAAIVEAVAADQNRTAPRRRRSGTRIVSRRSPARR
jgi:hydroxymethylpyrimidine/phosphomethylpyrimidine kinase